MISDPKGCLLEGSLSHTPLRSHGGAGSIDLETGAEVVSSRIRTNFTPGP